MFKKVREDWQRDKTLFFMEYIGYLIGISGNIWIMTRPISAYEVIFYLLIANLSGFFLIAPFVRTTLLMTVFKERFQKMVDKIIEKARGK